MNPIHSDLLQKVKNYKMPAAAIELLTTHRPLVIAGITAAGKETTLNAIEETGRGSKVVNHTTRHIRPGEENGKDYWFVTPERMSELIDEQSFIEVNLVHGLPYGSGIAAYQTIVDEGQKPIMVIDVQGIEDIRTHVPNLKAMFILPPDFDTWMERLERRSHMSHVEKLKRFESAKDELQRALDDEHFVLIVNHEVHKTAEEVLDGRSDSATQMRNRETAQRLLHSVEAYEF